MNLPACDPVGEGLSELQLALAGGGSGCLMGSRCDAAFPGRDHGQFLLERRNLNYHRKLGCGGNPRQTLRALMIIQDFTDRQNAARQGRTCTRSNSPSLPRAQDAQSETKGR